MSRDKTPSIPTYRLHKRSGQAVVSFPTGGGRYRDYYLGPFGTRATSPGSWSQYDRLIAEWLASGRALVTDAKTALTVAEVLDAYWAHAQDYYRRTDPLSGRTVATSQLERVRMALRPVRELYQDAEAARFGPLALKACRQSMIGRGLARTHVNQLAGCIKRWGAQADPESARILAGHADLGTTRLYLVDDLERAARFLGRVG